MNHEQPATMAPPDLPAGLTLRLWRDASCSEVVFESSGKWLHPLFELADFLRTNPSCRAPAPVLQDRVTGLGAAFLILDLDIPVLWTGVLSLPAEERLTTHGVAVQALERVPRIACMTDGLLAGIKTQAEGLAMLEERRRASLSRRHSPPADTPPAKPGKLAGLYALAIGFASLFWLLLRSGPKPSRLQYPCQQAAAGNVGLLLAPIAGASLLRWFRHLQSRARSGPSLWRSLVVPAICLAGILMGVAVFRQMRIAQGHAQAAATARHGAIGTLIAGSGISCSSQATEPGQVPVTTTNGIPRLRVVGVHNPAVSDWNGSGNPHTAIDQTVVDTMVRRGVMELSGKATATEAWRALIPYQSGEAIAIKLNFNNTYAGDWDSDPFMNPTAQLVNAVIEGLVSIGVPPGKIWLTDPSRIINTPFRERIVNQQVLFYCRTVGLPALTERVYPTSYVAADSPWATTPADYPQAIRPALVFVDAAHIINIPQLKGHGGASITLGLKNHFGSVSYTRDASGEHDSHEYFYVSGAHNQGSAANLLADINANPVFKQKTRLIVGDGLMGHPTVNYVDPVGWQTFGGKGPEMLFFGVDPVCTDSVMFDFLQAEAAAIGAAARVDDILHYAAGIGLGVHEHWNTPGEKRYQTIEYRHIAY